MNAADVLDTLKAARLPPPAALAAVVANPDDFASAVYETVEKAYRGVVLLPSEARVLLYGLHGLAAARHPDLWPRLVQVARLPEDDLDDLLLNHPESVLARLMLSAWDGDVDALLGRFARDIATGQRPFRRPKPDERTRQWRRDRW